MKTTKTAAMKQAKSESCMYRQGAGWIVSTWSALYRAGVLTNEVGYYVARSTLAEWRAARADALITDTGEKDSSVRYEVETDDDE